MHKIWLILGTIATFGAVIACLVSLNITRMDNEIIEKVVLEVDYYGLWEGTIIGSRLKQSWSGFGKKSMVLVNPQVKQWVLKVEIKKLDGSTNPLKLSISMVDGTVLKHATTNDPYGVASVFIVI